MIENYRFLATYNSWINQKIYESASKLSNEDRKKSCGAFFGSIHNTLNHLVLTDKVWLNRFASQGLTFKALNQDILTIPNGFQALNQILFEDFEVLKKHRFEMDKAIEAWLAEMSNDFTKSQMTYANTKGVVREHETWKALSHFFNHQTHHRGQITTLLNQFNLDIGVTDLIAMVN